MRISMRGVGSAVVVGIEGRLTVGTDTGALHRLVGQLGRSPVETIVFDLEKVGRMDCSGVGELVRLRNNVETAGGTLRLANVGRRQRELLELLHLVEPLSAFSSMREALSGYRRSGHAPQFAFPIPFTRRARTARARA